MNDQLLHSVHTLLDESYPSFSKNLDHDALLPRPYANSLLLEPTKEMESGVFMHYHHWHINDKDYLVEVVLTSSTNTLKVYLIVG